MLGIHFRKEKVKHRPRVNQKQRVSYRITQRNVYIDLTRSFDMSTEQVSTEFKVFTVAKYQLHNI